MLKRIILGFIALAFISSASWATFPGSPGSTQWRNPWYLRQFTTQILVSSNNSVAIDWRQGPIYKITLTGNVTFAVPTNIGEQCAYVQIVQDGVGSRTAAFANTSGGSGWKFAGGTAPTLTTTAAAVDVLVACPLSANSVIGSLIANVK